jgi:hypothetical protein
VAFAGWYQVRHSAPLTVQYHDGIFLSVASAVSLLSPATLKVNSESARSWCPGRPLLPNQTTPLPHVSNPPPFMSSSGRAGGAGRTQHARHWGQGNPTFPTAFSHGPGLRTR